MTNRTWVRLDNVSNIFLAARTEADPKVFRISAEMDHDVDPQLLQEALDVTYDRHRLYHAVLRSGVFWYYLQDSDLRPLVTADEQPTCAQIYQSGRRNLLFRLMHHHRRIILEVFHALSDGTGALWFLTDVVTAYTRLRYPDQAGTRGQIGAEARPEVPTGRAPTGSQPVGDMGEPVHGLIPDSFAHYFRGRRRRVTSDDAAAFSREATPAALTVAGDAGHSPEPESMLRRLRRPSGTKVHRVRGTRTPDNRTRAVELTMPAGDVLALARANGASPTIFLTALLFESIRLSSGGLGRFRTLAASVPVNLRQFFPSTSARNFFATIRIEYTYGQGADDLGSICRQLESQFRPKATPEALEKKVRRLIRLEQMPALRILPRPFKDVILGVVNRGNNRGLSVAVSNLGRVSLPEAADPHVRRMFFHVSAARPQICAITHAGLLAVSFTSPFTETDHIREFARLLTSHGIDVTVGAARVTAAELEEAGS